MKFSIYFYFVNEFIALLIANVFSIRDCCRGKTAWKTLISRFRVPLGTHGFKVRLLYNAWVENPFPKLSTI